MAIPWMDPVLALFCTVSIGGTLLGLVGLLRSPASRPRRWLGAPLVLGIVVGGFSAVAALAGQPLAIWLPPVALIGLWGLLQLLQTVSGRRWVLRGAALCSSARVQAAALLVCCPTLAAWWIMSSREPEPLPSEEKSLEAVQVGLGEFKRHLEEVLPGQVQTDKGLPIRVFRCLNRLPVTTEFLAKQTLEIRRLGFVERVLVFHPQDMDCNCYGHVFTGGHFWIADPQEVEAILRDNAYRLVGDPQIGDVAIYREVSGRIHHTGVVRTGGKGSPVLIESKWGEMSLYIHPPGVHPYNWTQCYFYRSPRPNHILRGIPDVPADPRTVVQAMD